MKVYRETADASMYYRETTAADYVRVDSSAFPVRFPLFAQVPVQLKQVEEVVLEEGRVGRELSDIPTEQVDR